MSDLSEETVNTIMAMLPDDIDDAHLSALVLTIVATYSRTPVEGLSFLASTLLTHARANGIRTEIVGNILRDCAEYYENNKPTAH
jgi:hypothetical protein